MIDLRYTVEKSEQIDINKMSMEEIEEHLFLVGHCSAIIKLSNDMKEIYAGHDSWFYYNMMLRIFKRYIFDFTNPLRKAK